MKRASPALSVDDVFTSDDRWIKLMANSRYFTDFMDVILANNKREWRVCYRGNFFYSTKEDITPLIDEETHDIVTSFASKFKPVKGQQIFASPAEYFLEHPLVKDCANIYFVGDVHGASTNGEFDVHWNCFICEVDEMGKGKRVIWYDPALSEENVDDRYNFTKSKKTHILNTLYRLVGKTELRDAIPDIQAQRVCNPNSPCVDSFCQTWVMMFVAAYVEGKVHSFLFDLDFDEYGNLILKSWLYCLVKNEGMSEWMKELKTKELKGFEYCRLPPILQKGMSRTEKRAPRLVKVETLKRDKGQTCLDVILNEFKVIPE